MQQPYKATVAVLAHKKKQKILITNSLDPLNQRFFNKCLVNVWFYEHTCFLFIKNQKTGSVQLFSIFQIVVIKQLLFLTVIWVSMKLWLRVGFALKFVTNFIASQNWFHFIQRFCEHSAENKPVFWVLNVVLHTVCLSVVTSESKTLRHGTRCDAIP